MLNWLNNKYRILGLSFLVLAIFNATLIVLWKAPVSVAYACVTGENLTLPNVFFALSISILLSMNCIGLYVIFRNEQVKNNVTLSSLGGVGFLMWLISTVCFACYLPIISILGFNFSLNFLNFFEGWAQFLGIGLAGLGVYMVDRQIREGCRNGKCEI